jgi:hypothetical protein
VYDLYLDGLWEQRVADWLAFDLALSPGLYGDFRTTPPQAFRLRGHGYGLVSLTENFRLLGGVDYLNRDSVKLLPVGGILWEPGDGVQLQLVFPRPRVTWRLGEHDGATIWGYTGGEFGGGAWAFKNEHGGHRSVEYNDLRVVAGVESGSRYDGHQTHLEVGYVFGRKINFTDLTPDFTPRDTVLVSLWFSY